MWPGGGGKRIIFQEDTEDEEKKGEKQYCKERFARGVGDEAVDGAVDWAERGSDVEPVHRPGASG